MRPPHYRHGSRNEHCGNCGAYSAKKDSKMGYCRMFEVKVERDAVCDRWYPVRTIRFAKRKQKTA